MADSSTKKIMQLTERVSELMSELQIIKSSASIGNESNLKLVFLYDLNNI